MIPATAIRAFLLFMVLMAAPTVDAEAVKFCDLVKAPEQYAGRMVELRALVDKSFHFVVLFDDA